MLARRNLQAFYAELQDCRQILEDIIGADVDYVAYPSGGYDAHGPRRGGRFGFRAGLPRAPRQAELSSPVYTASHPLRPDRVSRHRNLAGSDPPAANLRF